MAPEPAGRRFRVHDRRVFRLPVTVTHAATGWLCDAQILNIGLGGACIELHQPLEPGERAIVSLVAPALWDPLTVGVRVAWSRPSAGGANRAGVSFEHEGAPAVLALFQLVADAVY